MLGPDTLAWTGGRFAGRWSMRGERRRPPAAARGSLRRPSALRSLGPGFGRCLGRRVLGCGAFGFRPEDRDLVLPIVSALAGDGPMREKFAAGLGAVYPLVVALRQESGQLGFDLPALVFREETTRQLGAQFVDMIDLEHFFVSVVDGARAREDRVEDRNATGGAGEGRSRF